MRHSMTDALGVAGTMSRFWQRSYAADYLGFAMLLTAYIYVGTIIQTIKGHSD